jgi:hypothetical protein
MEISRPELGKRHCTVGAFIGLLIKDVGPLMGQFIDSRFKGFHTELAEVPVVFGVDSAMTFQGCIILEPLTTNIAENWLDFVLACVRLAHSEKRTAIWTKFPDLFTDFRKTFVLIRAIFFQLVRIRELGFGEVTLSPFLVRVIKLVLGSLRFFCFLILFFLSNRFLI